MSWSPTTRRQTARSIVAGQLLAYSMNAILAQYRGGPQAVVGHDPSGAFVQGSTHSWDQLQNVIGLTVAGGNGDTWRYMLVLATIPAIALGFGIRFMPESARWYASHLRVPQAIDRRRHRPRRDRTHRREPAVKNVLLGVSGSIAAYKAADIANDLTKAGHNVDVILTAGGSKFITPFTLQTDPPTRRMRDTGLEPKV